MTLPDTSTWLPREGPETFGTAFLERCVAAEASILIRVAAERASIQYGYDSGPGVEDLVREDIRQFLPNRYSVKAGSIVDRTGRTAGDCDLVVFNDTWFPEVKAGATSESRRIFLPIEGVYAVGEIKQTLSLSVLDDAMEKLVKVHRLDRPPNSMRALTENRDAPPGLVGICNPLYSFIFATALDSETTLDEVIDRFAKICQQLRRTEVVRAICILGVGTVVWAKQEGSTGMKPAVFMGNEGQAVLWPGFFRADQSRNALFQFMENLFLHLFVSILSPADIVPSYGMRMPRIETPDSPSLCLQPELRPSGAA